MLRYHFDRLRQHRRHRRQQRLWFQFHLQNLDWKCRLHLLNPMRRRRQSRQPSQLHQNLIRRYRRQSTLPLKTQS
jgi:hypothetical protein